MDTKTTIYGAIALAVACLILGFVAGGELSPETVVKETSIQYVENPFNSELEEKYEVALAEIEKLEAREPEVQTVIEQVPVVDKDFLQYIYDSNGDIEHLLSDLDDNELYLMQERVSFIKGLKDKAISVVAKEIFDEADKYEVTLEDGTIVELDDKDMRRLRIKDNYDEIEVVYIDFEDKDAELKVSFRFEQDDVKFEGSIVLEFKDGEFDDFSDLEITERI